MRTHTVKDVMTEYVVSVLPEASFKDIVTALAHYGVSAVPVIEADRRVLGVVSEDDLLHKIEFGGGEAARLFDSRRRRVAKEKAAGDSAADLMTAPAITIEPTATVGEAARLMETRRVKRLPVVREGRLVGIVSRRDVLRVYLRADADIEREVEGHVLRRTLMLDPEAAMVRVNDGVATLIGSSDRRSTAEIAERLTRAVDGVVRVVNDMRWEYDDTADARQRFPYF